MKTFRRFFSTDAIRQTFDSVLHNFPCPFAYASALVVWLIIMVYGCTADYHVINDSVCWTLFEGFIMSLTANLWCEFLDRRRAVKVAQIVVLAFVVVDFIVLCMRGGVSGTAEFVGRAAMTTAFTAAIFFLPSVRRLDRRKLWLYTVWQFGAVAMAVFIGAVMAISCLIIFSSINTLFGIYDEKHMMTAMCVLVIWVPVVIYLSRIPKLYSVAYGELPGASPVGSFCKNVMLPLVSVYMLILYVYAAKILFTWELPQASVTWMVAGLMCASLIMLYGLQRYSFDGNVSVSALKIYSIARFMLPLALLPLLILMSIGLIYRVGEYSITVSRLYVAAFNVWAYGVVLYLIFKKNANLNLVAVSFAVVFALVSMIPGMNFTSIADRKVRTSVIDTLRNHGVETFPISEEKLVEILEEMDLDEAANLASRIEYLDDWNDHSRIRDIVVSEEKLASWRLLPDYDEVEFAEDVADSDFVLQCSDIVVIPEGFTKVSYGAYFGIEHPEVDSCGFTSIEYDGYRASINVDSLLVVKNMDTPLCLTAKNSEGEEARIVFTYIQIDKDSVLTITRPRYYLFTK